MRCIIAGSRTVVSYRAICCAMLGCGFDDRITVVVSGGAAGVDLLGERWARDMDLPVNKYPVTSEDWRRHGKAAGVIRNARMARNADALVAVFDGTRPRSNGTANMVVEARRLGLLVYESFWPF